MSQSAVSQAVALLERTLGVPLLVRGRDGVTPTTLGAAALGEAQAALSAVERLAAGATPATSLSGSLSIGVVQSAAIRLLPTWMRLLRAEHPGITVTLYEGTDPEVMAWMLAGVVELGVTSRTHADLTAWAICKDDYVVVVPNGHAFAGRATVSLQDLNAQRMLQSGGGCETLIEELLAAAASNPEIVCLVRDNATLISMVREGLGLTIMPELALPSDHQGFHVVRLRPTLCRTLHLLSKPPEALGPFATAFMEMVKGSNQLT